MVKKKEQKKEEIDTFKHIVRIARTDVNGNKTIGYGLTSIKGIGYRTACVIADELGLDKNQKMGDISDEDEKALMEFIENDIEKTFPPWMLNRCKDPEFGDDAHVVSIRLNEVFKDDVDKLKKMHCYRGVRHMSGLKVRGQRTKSNGRRGLALGVKRKK